jgi:hypothetical protein
VIVNGGKLIHPIGRAYLAFAITQFRLYISNAVARPQESWLMKRKGTIMELCRGCGKWGYTVMKTASCCVICHRNRHPQIRNMLRLVYRKSSSSNALTGGWGWSCQKHLDLWLAVTTRVQRRAPLRGFTPETGIKEHRGELVLHPLCRWMSDRQALNHTIS